MMPRLASKTRVKVGPFIAALILGPALSGLIAFLLFQLTIQVTLAFWVTVLFGAPSLGILVGWPYYLILGTPVLWLAARHDARGFMAFGIAGVVANFGSPLIAGPLGESIASPMELLGFGTVAAFVWCGTFGQVYAWLGGHGT